MDRVSRPHGTVDVGRTPCGFAHGAAECRNSAPTEHLRSARLWEFSGALRLTPVAGRFIRSDEVEQPGGEPVVVVSHDYWQTHLAGSPSAIGQTIRVNDNHLTIIGIAPESFQGTILGLQFNLWVPATLAPALFAGIGQADPAQPARLYADGPVTRRRGRSQGDRGVRPRRWVRWRPRFPETNERQASAAGGADALLAPLQAADDVDHRPRRPAGGHAAGAARGVRQHRESCAGARERATSGSRSGPRPSALDRQRDPLDARGEFTARPAWRRGWKS